MDVRMYARSVKMEFEQISSFRLPSLPALHVGEEKFKSIAQRPHIRVHGLLQLERMWHDFHRPTL